jgi:hypothetical protein
MALEMRENDKTRSPFEDVCHLNRVEMTVTGGDGNDILSVHAVRDQHGATRNSSEKP